MEIRLAGTVSDSIVDGPGLRYVVFVQGCPRSCPGCHNPQTHDPLGGYLSTTESLLQEIKSDKLLDGVTFSGGEPFMQPVPLTSMAEEIHKFGLNVIVYTGYCWEELIEANRDDWNELIKNVAVVIDGPFRRELRNWKLSFRGSSNQRFIDVKRTLKGGKLVVMDQLILPHLP